jgi:hypothetical protein
VLERIQTEFAVCGVAPFSEHLVLLSYLGDFEHFEDVIPDEDEEQVLVFAHFT